MSSEQTYPLVSVVMPVRNEESFIARSLGAVLAQDYPAERLEILVVDGMSADGTRQVIARVARQGMGHSVHIVENPQRIFSSGFNLGLAQAQGEVIIMLGGHTELAPDYVRRCVEQLVAHPECACVGGVIETVAETPVGRTIALAMSSPFGVGGVAFRTGARRPLEVDTVAFGAYRREAMERCGPLDEELVRNQDDEYNYRLRALGERILLAPEIRARYHSRASLGSLWRQYFQYGYWKVRVMQKHPRQMRPRHFVPAAFVAALFGAALGAFFSPWGRGLLALVAGAYLLANLAASFLAARRAGWRHLPLLPLAFATLHLSYGLGFLVGLVRFAGRWRESGRRFARKERS